MRLLNPQVVIPRLNTIIVLSPTHYGVESHMCTPTTLPLGIRLIGTIVAINFFRQNLLLPLEQMLLSINI